MINSYRNYAIILVVFIHTHIYLLTYAQPNVPFFIAWIYSKFLGYFHPASVLAAITGYLYFKDIDSNNYQIKQFIRTKYIKRLQIVLIPYIFWISLFFWEIICYYILIHSIQKPFLHQSIMTSPFQIMFFHLFSLT